MESTLDRFLDKCEELRVKIWTKKFMIGSQVKFGGLLVKNEEGRVHIEADPGKLDKLGNFPEPGNRDDVAI